MTRPRFASRLDKPAGLLGLCAVLLPVAVQAQTRNWPSERPPRPIAAREVKFPPFAVRTLANGLQVIAVSHHEQPAVSVRLIVRAGAAQDPADKPGVAALAATLLDQGTAGRTAEQIANAVDSIGGAMGVGAGTDLSFINAVVMKDGLNLALDVVADVALRPAFAPEEIERQRQQSLSGMQVSYEDPEFLADIVFDRLVYGFHPYGRPQTGTPQSIAALTRDDLVAFHKKWFGANNAILAIVGDVTADEAFAGAERAFGKWARAETEVLKNIAPPPPTRRLVIIDKPGSVQTEIRAGNIAIPRKHNDYMALDLASKVLGGEGANRLFRVLRTERGLTYGASADFNALKEWGDIVAQTNTKSETTGETLRLMVDEIWKIQRDRVGDRELEGAQEYLTGSFPLTIETPSQIATQILNAVFFGLDMNELQTYRERVNAVRVDDVQRVARAYLSPDRLTIVLVGDAATVTRQLPGAGFDKFEVIPLTDLDLGSADLRRKPATRGAGGGYRPVSFLVPVSEHQSDGAKTILHRAIAAKGGHARLQSIKTVRLEGTMTTESIGKPIPFPVVMSIEYPSRFRMEASMPEGKVVQVYADGRFWVETQAGVNELDAKSAGPVRAIIDRDIVQVLLRAAAGQVVVREVDSDNPQTGAIELSGQGLAPVTLFVNRDNGLIEKARYLDDRYGRTEELFSDYRTVDGIRFPFHTVVRRANLPPLERDIKTIRYNVPLSPALFRLRSPDELRRVQKPS